MKPWIEEFFVGKLEMRCSIVCNPENGATIIIDGGEEPQRLIDWVENWQGLGPDESNGPSSQDEAEERGFPKRRIIAYTNTHAHFDHSGMIPELKKRWDVPFWLHQGDHHLQSCVQESAARWRFTVPEPAVPTDVWQDGEIYDFEGIKVEARHTPGHSLGSVCLIIPDEGGASHAFVGDVLFAGGVGRTDLPNSGGSWPLLKQSIEQKLFTLEDDTIVYPGHGPKTTIGIEKKSNPYVGELSKTFTNVTGRYM
jgi:glyoxylase-like metal-dependent hydrolase (beta-lactamase superfamily II)